eukprot:scaffold4264_cov116-Isochrysis_galbana.AAC.14
MGGQIGQTAATRGSTGRCIAGGCDAPAERCGGSTNNCMRHHGPGGSGSWGRPIEQACDSASRHLNQRHPRTARSHLGRLWGFDEQPRFHHGNQAPRCDSIGERRSAAGVVGWCGPGTAAAENKRTKAKTKRKDGGPGGGAGKEPLAHPGRRRVMKPDCALTLRADAAAERVLL